MGDGNMRRILAMALAVAASGCSNWQMPHDTGLSGRTTDLGSIPGLTFEMQSLPRSSKVLGSKLLPGGVTQYGYLGINPTLVGKSVGPMVAAGINEKGLTCDMQTLITTEMPPPSNTTADLFIELFCQWALGGFADTDSVRAALLNSSRVHVYGSSLESGAKGQHYSLRDAAGRSLVVEWVGGKQQVYQDLDDDGKTGWGIMTNEPEYPYMVRMVQHFEWKQSLARPSTSIPGAFYPDERFLRIHLVKRGLPIPKDYREAIMQAVHVLNTVTVPPGSQMGTDSGPGEGQGDHTMWGVICARHGRRLELLLAAALTVTKARARPCISTRGSLTRCLSSFPAHPSPTPPRADDHRNASIYFREQQNQNLQRVRLADLQLGPGSAIVTLPMGPTNQLAWWSDAVPSFHKV